MIKEVLLTGVVAFFAMNMGASGIAPAFAGIYGGKMIKKKKAIILFSVFVIIGALLLGRNVALTLGKELLPAGMVGFDAALIILASAALSLFLANILKIPQSTSQVTVGAAAGAGWYFGRFNLEVFCLKILPVWIVLPLASYLLTFMLYRKIYPPEHDNLHIYQKVFANKKKMKLSALVASCYVAFAIGTNNVANAVGPLYGAGILGINTGLILIAPLFGVGAGLMGKGTLETVGREIVPLGPVSGTLVSFVTATLLIFASLLGIPQSLVQLNLAAIFSISCVKNGHRYTLDQHLTRKTFLVWAVTPLISIGVSYLLLSLFLRK